MYRNIQYDPLSALGRHTMAILALEMWKSVVETTAIPDYKLIANNNINMYSYSYCHSN